jgi:hypothetical protein
MAVPHHFDNRLPAHVPGDALINLCFRRSRKSGALNSRRAGHPVSFAQRVDAQGTGSRISLRDSGMTSKIRTSLAPWP